MATDRGCCGIETDCGDLEKTLEMVRMSVRKMSTTRYSEVESFDCPICLNMVLPPIHVICENQHIVCNECLPELVLRDDKCPTCRGNLRPVRRSYQAEDILQWLLSAPKNCKFRLYGCKFSANRGIPDHVQSQQIEEHEESCSYSWEKLQSELRNIGNELETLSLCNLLKQIAHKQS